MTARRSQMTMAVVLVLVVVLRHGLGLRAFTSEAEDDALFFRLASSISSGRWLGAYDQTTLSKGPVLSILVAVASAVGLSVKTLELDLHLLAATTAAVAGWRISRSWGLTAAVFSALALNPMLWEASMMRLVREPSHAAFSLCLVALLAILVFGRSDGSDGSKSRSSVALAGVAGAVFALYWSTCDERIWLCPAFAVLFAYGFHGAMRARSSWRSSLVGRSASVVAAAGGVAVVVLPILLLNWSHYGAFTTTETGGGPFADACGALARIEVASSSPYVPVPRAAREIAYEVSPAAAELRPFLEGEIGSRWSSAACVKAGDACAHDLPGEWFVGALRDAAAAAGHSAHASDAATYYALVAHEIDAACDTERIRCSGRRAFARPLGLSDLAPLLRSAAAALAVIVQQEERHLEPGPSVGDPLVLAQWQRLVGRTAPGHSRIVVRGWVAAGASPGLGVVRDAKPEPLDVTYNPAPDVDAYFASIGQPATVSRRFSFSTSCVVPGCALSIVAGGSLVHQIPLAGLVSPVKPVTPPGIEIYFEVVSLHRVAARRGESFKYDVVRGYEAFGELAWPALWIIAAIGLAFHLAFNRSDRTANALAVLAMASLAAAATRALMFARLEARSGSFSVDQRYLSPAYAFGVLYALVGSWLLLRTLRVLRASRVAESKVDAPVVTNAPRRADFDEYVHYFRGLAAVGVMLFHVSSYLDSMLKDGRFHAVFNATLGIHCVGMFFAISGYLMASIVKREPAPVVFLAPRVLRIYPMYGIAVALFTGVFTATVPSWACRASTLVLGLTLAPVGLTRYLLGIEWTLVFETTFYVLLFLVISIAKRPRVALIGSTWLLVLFLMAVSGDMRGGWLPSAHQLMISDACAGLAAGMLVPTLLERRVRPWPFLVVPFCSVAAATHVSQNTTVLMAGLSGAVIIACAVDQSRGSRRPPAPVRGVLSWLGDCSYALYLCHVPILRLVFHFGGGRLPTSVLWFVALAASLIGGGLLGALDVRLYRQARAFLPYVPRSALRVSAVVFVGAFSALIVYGEVVSRP